MSTRDIIAANLDHVKERMARAAERSGRSPDAVKLVAVTKTVGVEEIRIIAELGVRDIGENRVQDALRKMDSLTDLDLSWHMIGHLQRNKANKVLGRFATIHSIDSLRLAHTINSAAAKRGLRQEVLIQVNVSGEETKHGFAPDQLPAALEEMARLESLKVTGLMTMAPLVQDPERTRPVFRAMRELRDKLAPICPPPIRLEHLSMGMTQDFEIAIEEGADIVRIGTALFRPPEG